MPYLTVVGYGTFEVEKGKKLVLALEDNGINILHRCGGRARCTTCRVEMLAGDYCDLSALEKEAFEKKEIEGVIEDHLRLSCQIRITEDLTVRPILTAESSGMEPGPRPEE
ncbi:2Fe-2S iron-sulfur cluster-binding protein [Bacillus thermotolerans]|uniref:Ferredoxin n=1 Tax=Bacillus thermotolerans TaxID=1221996 RepID=A0A0F5HJC8_BACTR|nr:2Fe-2S iron-sulfur cluster-binding protein [Bacillus thermotolerans]KKB33504.1 Ferredoxin [Bacillus thermotolerans]KKB36293.1 Ferredoxin [Bacillus thermotolerans]KKB44828.1 Ferredoxin [Bacillus thermotolerans]